jgi:hypothetical protein
VADKVLLEEADVLVQEKLVELQKAQAEYDAFAGPSSLPKLIASRRRDGVLMPFKVNMVKGSPLALTVWPGLNSEGEDGVDEDKKSDVKSNDIQGVNALSPGSKKVVSDIATVSSIGSASVGKLKESEKNKRTPTAQAVENTTELDSDGLPINEVNPMKNIVSCRYINALSI